MNLFDSAVYVDFSLKNHKNTEKQLGQLLINA